jgi:5-hydroxyisourate hydrolase-like protein (transthyretin family)
MARISIHVLDTANGRPADGIPVRLYRAGVLLKSATTNGDGRTSESGEIYTDPRPPYGVLGLTLRR